MRFWFLWKERELLGTPHARSSRFPLKEGDSKTKS